MIRVGVQLPEVEREAPWTEYAAMAQGAEAGGFDSIWLGDHLLYRGDGREERGPWEVWTMLAALAVATERVEGLSPDLQARRLTQSVHAGSSKEHFLYRARQDGWYYVELKLPGPGAGQYRLHISKSRV